MDFRGIANGSMSASSASLKILHILNHSLPFHSGYAFRTQNILQTQRKRGWQFVGLTSPIHNQLVKSCLKQEEIVEGVRYYRTEARPLRGFSLYREGRLIRIFTRRIRQVVELEKPDLLHIHSPVFNALASLRVARQLGVPTVSEVRAFWEGAGVDQGIYRQGSWEYRLRRSLETWACLTGSAQIASCWLILYQHTDDVRYRDAAYVANRYVRRTLKVDGPPETRGAIKGSFPVDGDYSPYQYLNWACKFFIDANLLEQAVRGV